MWRLVACGVDSSNALLLMSGFLTLLRLRTVPPRSPLPTHDMRKQKGGRMRSELGWWSTRLLCQPSSRRQVEWGRLLLHYTRESPPCCPRRPVRHTAPQWPGSGNELLGSTDNIVRKFIPRLLREIPMLARIARVTLYSLL